MGTAHFDVAFVEKWGEVQGNEVEWSGQQKLQWGAHWVVLLGWVWDLWECSDSKRMDDEVYSELQFPQRP